MNNLYKFYRAWIFIIFLFLFRCWNNQWRWISHGFSSHRLS